MQKSTPKNLLWLVFLPVFFLFQSCMKDVDLDQINDIVIPPEAAIDLVYFKLDPSHFVDRENSQINVVEDVVRLEFLDDNYIQNGLMRADFNFKYTNNFRQPFTSSITFMSENNSENYKITFSIPAGNPDSPQIKNYTEIIGKADIEAIRKSIKMKIELKMLPNFQPIEGGLQLKAKAFYKFEFK